jgi:plasmid stabilization system protein ParE
MPIREKPALPKSNLEIWLTFISSFAWPIALLLIVFTFRGQLAELTGRVRTGEFAGAKFEFSEAAAGFIRASVDDLAKEQNPQKREELAKEIRSVADALTALHPRALALLVTGVKGCMRWVGSQGAEMPYFARLESLGLVNLVRGTDDGKESLSLKYTPKGKELLLAIGMSNEDLKSADRCR